MPTTTLPRTPKSVYRNQNALIRAIFERHGAQAKISNIHVNGWFGDYDKLAMVRLFTQRRFGMEVDPAAWAFCGDSPNDEPMFAYFPLSFGMANVRPFLSMMESPPAIVTNGEGGAGFREVADLVLRARNNGGV